MADQTLSNAERAAQDILSGKLASPKSVAGSYDATQRSISAPEDTVQGQITGLLDKDSRYIQRAKVAGTTYAASRGLLNTSIAAGATEAAAIDAALPIAQQDADTYFRQGLENQSASNTALSTNAQLLNQINLANAQNEATLKGQALTTSGTLAGERISQIGQTARQTAGDIAAGERQAAGDVATGERQTAADAASLIRQQAADTATMERTQFSELEQTGRQELISQTAIQTNNVKIISNELINNQDIAQKDRDSFTDNVNEVTRQRDVELTDIYTDSDLSADEKNRLTTNLNDSTDSTVELFAGVYEVPLELDNSSDISAISAMYTETLGREADPGGRDYYLGQLESGDKTLEDIQADLTWARKNEPEYANVTDADTYTDDTNDKLFDVPVKESPRPVVDPYFNTPGDLNWPS